MPVPTRHPTRHLPRAVALGLCAALAGGLAGCNALGGGGGVMPAGDVGPPPSLRTNLPARQARTAVDEDGNALQTAPTRTLNLPKNARGEARSTDASERRIRREDLEGADATPGRSGGGMGPALTPGGGVGMGGRF